MGKKWLIFWLVGVWSFVAGLWWAHRGTPLPEHDHALPLEKLIAKVEKPEVGEWLTQFQASTESVNLAARAPDGTPGAEEASCTTCHEVEASDLAASAHAGDGGEGVITCAACHIRDGRAYGPPHAPNVGASDQATKGASEPSAQNTPAQTAETTVEPVHHTSVERGEFESPSFCAGCHEPPTLVARGGKRFVETTEEWMRTDVAAQGKTCVTCHMPDGRHLWKGVHDREMVSSAITADVRFMTQGTEVAGKLTVSNTGAGHRLPTTAGPELVLTIDQLDGAALPIPGTHAEGIIGRRLDDAATIELFDTRLLPGESKILPYITSLHPDARAFRARVECRPEAAALRKWPDAVAAARTDAVNFTAWEEIVRLPAE